MVVGAGPSSKSPCGLVRLVSSDKNAGADLVRELGMLRVEKSPAAPLRVYRSLRSKPRYDTEHEKGWAEHIVNVAPIRTVEPPSTKSATGRIVTVEEEILDYVDVSIKSPPVEHSLI